MLPLHLTLMTLKGQCQGNSDFEGLYLVKRAELGHMLLLNIMVNHIWDAQMHHQI